jgi:hypothetical protein
VDAIVAACVDPKEEQPVGGKARVADVSHHLFPGLTERGSAKVSDAESKKGTPVPATTGPIYEPMAGTTTVDGGIRERMEREDAAADDR